MQFEIMRKDIHIASAEITAEGTMTNFKVNHDYDELLPLQERTSPKYLKAWWDKRSVPLTQGGVANLLEKAGIDTPSEFMVKNLGLSLTDYYWIRPVDSNLKWKDINLFDNDFAPNRITDSKKRVSGKISAYTPESTLQGQLEKGWIIRNGERFLLKGNRDEFSNESINEVISSEMHRLQGYDNYAPYELCRIKGSRYDYGCLSKTFTSQKLELVSAYAVVTSEKKGNDISYFEHFINVCGKHGIDTEQLRKDLEYTILTDYAITNTDRHLSNISVLRDADTLKFIRMAPIYDTGKALFVGKAIPKAGEDFADIETVSWSTTEKKLLKYVKNKNLIDIDVLPDSNWIKEQYMKDSKQDEYRVDAICKAYNIKKLLLQEYITK